MCRSSATLTKNCRTSAILHVEQVQHLQVEQLQHLRVEQVEFSLKTLTNDAAMAFFQTG